VADAGTQSRVHRPGPRRTLRRPQHRRDRRTGLTFAQVKALATGNPDIVEKAAVDAEIAALQRSQRAHRAEQHRLHRQRPTVERDLADTIDRIAALTDAIARRRPGAGQHLRGRALQPTAFDAALRAELDALPRAGTVRSVGEIDGLALHLRRFRVDGDIELTLADPAARLTVDLAAADATSPRNRLLTRLRNRISDLDARLARVQRRRDDLTSERDRLIERLDLPWPRHHELAAAQRRNAELQAAIDADIRRAHAADQPDPAAGDIGVEL
jgi:hypothetical protein